jgi:hypothetical protein
MKEKSKGSHETKKQGKSLKEKRAVKVAKQQAAKASRAISPK